MQPTNLTYEQEQHVESHAPYLKIGFILFVFTVTEYFYAWYASTRHLSFSTLVVGLLAMALTKAALVGWYFMHLKFEGNWVYMMLIPAGFLVLVFLGALYPDIGMQDPSWPSEEESSAVAPLEPGTALANC